MQGFDQFQLNQGSKMEKYLFIGDSHQSALLPIKIALFLGIPFLMGKGYCSSTNWPNVSRFDGNGNGDGDSDGRYFGLYPFSRKKRLLQTFTFYMRTFTFYTSLFKS